MTVVLADNLVLFQVPTLDLLVLSRREKVGMAIRDCQTSHCIDMASQGYFKLTCGQIPELDRPIVTSRDEKPIHWVDGKTPHPPVVTSNDCFQSPRCVPLWLNHSTLSQHDLTLVKLEGFLEALSVLSLSWHNLTLLYLVHSLLGNHAHFGGLSFF